MRNIIIKKKCLLFKHEKNNQTLSNDWLTYCHKGIWKGSVLSFLKDKVEWKMSDTGSAHWASSFLLNCIKYLPILSKTKKNLWTQNLIFWMKAHCPDPQGLVTIQVNILSMTMYKHIQGRTSFFTPARFKSCLFFKFLLIYSKPCLVQLLVVGCKYCYVLLHQCIIFFTVRDYGVYYPCNDDHIIVCYQSQDSNQMFIWRQMLVSPYMEYHLPSSQL